MTSRLNFRWPDSFEFEVKVDRRIHSLHASMRHELIYLLWHYACCARIFSIESTQNWWSSFSSSTNSFIEHVDLFNLHFGEWLCCRPAGFRRVNCERVKRSNGKEHWKERMKLDQRYFFFLMELWVYIKNEEHSSSNTSRINYTSTIYILQYSKKILTGTSKKTSTASAHIINYSYHIEFPVTYMRTYMHAPARGIFSRQNLVEKKQ